MSTITPTSLHRRKLGVTNSYLFSYTDYFLMDQKYPSCNLAFDLFQTRKRKGPPEALLKIIFGRRYIKPQIHVDLFRTRISERSAGGFAQIHLGQQYLRFRWALTLSTHKRRKGPLEVVPKYLSLISAFDPSKHKRRKGLPEALPKFILGKHIINLAMAFDPS